MKPLFSMQTAIGWDIFVRGKLAKEWRLHQCEYDVLEDRNQRIGILREDYITGSYPTCTHVTKTRLNI